MTQPSMNTNIINPITPQPSETKKDLLQSFTIIDNKNIFVEELIRIKDEIIFDHTGTTNTGTYNRTIQKMGHIKDIIDNIIPKNNEEISKVFSCIKTLAVKNGKLIHYYFALRCGKCYISEVEELWNSTPTIDCAKAEEYLLDKSSSGQTMSFSFLGMDKRVCDYPVDSAICTPYKYVNYLMSSDPNKAFAIAELIQDDFIFPDYDSNEVYIWSETTALWVPYNINIMIRITFEIINIISANMVVQIRKKCEISTGDVNLRMEAEKVVKYFENLPKTITNTSLKVISEHIKLALVQKSQVKFGKFNQSNYVIPLKNKSCLDFTNVNNITHRARKREDYFTHELNVILNMNAESKLVDTYINDLVLDDIDDKRFLMQLLGYILLGINIRQIIVFCIGKTSNGKSKLFRLLENILGFFYTTIDHRVFMERKNSKSVNDPNPTLLQMKGKRFILSSEIGVGERLNEGLIKAISGGDRIGARGLYQKNIVNFVTTGTIVFNTNDMPLISNDDAINRRIVVVPFRTTFVDNPKSSTERKKCANIDDIILSDENHKSAFFKFMVLGAVNSLLKWEDSKAVIVATTNIIDTNTRVCQFITENFDFEPQSVIQAHILASKYDEWCKMKNYPSMSIQALGNAIGQMIFKNVFGGKLDKVRRNSGNYYRGIILKLK